MKRQVLFIDDDTDDREVFCEAMAEIAPELICRAIGGGEAALAVLMHPETTLPDLIFLDINMPLMNGWEFLSLLKQNQTYGHVPVIMYSTSSRQGEMEAAQQRGALGLIRKPDSYEQLKSVLRAIVPHIYAGSLKELRTHLPLG